MAERNTWGAICRVLLVFSCAEVISDTDRNPSISVTSPLNRNPAYCKTYLIVWRIIVHRSFFHGQCAVPLPCQETSPGEYLNQLLRLIQGNMFGSVLVYDRTIAAMDSNLIML